MLPHPDPLYRVEGDPAGAPTESTTHMQPVGADEIVIETPDHNRKLEDLSEDQILMVMEAWRQRIEDLKRDRRFKYVSVYKNYGPLAGQEGSHAHSQITATTFVPRRILYELRAAREWYKEKERCVFCDIVKQEERQGKRIVDTQGEYVALCPYASRVPYEVWLLDRKHNYLFEQPRPGSNRRHLAALLRRVLRRIRQVAPAYHLVVHTSPNTIHPKGETSTVLENNHGRLPLAHRNPAHRGNAKQVLQHQGSVLQRHSCRKRRPNGCANWTRTRETRRTRRHFLPSAVPACFLRLSGVPLHCPASADASRRESSGWWTTCRASPTCIIVLGDDNYAGDRAFHAAELYRERGRPVVVASGRMLRPYAGIAEMMEHDLESFGVPAASIVKFSHRAENTREEARSARGLIAAAAGSGC